MLLMQTQKILPVRRAQDFTLLFIKYSFFFECQDIYLIARIFQIEHEGPVLCLVSVAGVFKFLVHSLLNSADKFHYFLHINTDIGRFFLSKIEEEIIIIVIVIITIIIVISPS